MDSMKIPYFDAHCDTIGNCKWHKLEMRRNPGYLDLERMAAYRKAAQFFAIYHPLHKAPADGMFAVARRQQEFFAGEMAKVPDLAVHCRTAREVAEANAGGKIAAVLTCEGSELLNCDPANLDWAQSVGVRAINLTWNHANFLCGSHKSEPERGLNSLGKEFVRQAQSRGILIDVSHCSDPAFWDLAAITEKPILASHSNSRAVCGHTRNLTDDMFRAIMETGGAAGINFYAAFVTGGKTATLEDAAAHVDHFMELGGAKNVCLGGDWDGCREVAGDMRGIEDLPAFWEVLARRGYPEDVLEDLFYNNLLRVLSEV